MTRSRATEGGLKKNCRSIIEQWFLWAYEFEANHNLNKFMLGWKALWPFQRMWLWCDGEKRKRTNNNCWWQSEIHKAPLNYGKIFPLSKNNMWRHMVEILLILNDECILKSPFNIYYLFSILCCKLSLRRARKRGDADSCRHQKPLEVIHARDTESSSRWHSNVAQVSYFKINYRQGRFSWKISVQIFLRVFWLQTLWKSFS